MTELAHNIELIQKVFKIRHAEMDDMDKILLIRIILEQMEDGPCLLSIQQLAREASISRSSAFRHLKNLQNLGLLTLTFSDKDANFLKEKKINKKNLQAFVSQSAEQTKQPKKKTKARHEHATEEPKQREPLKQAGETRKTETFGEAPNNVTRIAPAATIEKVQPAQTVSPTPQTQQPVAVERTPYPESEIKMPSWLPPGHPGWEVWDDNKKPANNLLNYSPADKLKKIMNILRADASVKPLDDVNVRKLANLVTQRDWRLGRGAKIFNEYLSKQTRDDLMPWLESA